jgi:hypothetical protein
MQLRGRGFTQQALGSIPRTIKQGEKNKTKQKNVQCLGPTFTNSMRSYNENLKHSGQKW